MSLVSCTSSTPEETAGALGIGHGKRAAHVVAWYERAEHKADEHRSQLRPSREQWTDEFGLCPPRSGDVDVDSGDDEVFLTVPA